MSLADYLAKNYLTADSDKKSKKRKRKEKNGGLIIDDDDNLGWKDQADEDDDDAPMISEFCFVFDYVECVLTFTQWVAQA
jgi:pre-mRNA-splicing factor CWC26